MDHAGIVRLRQSFGDVFSHSHPASAGCTLGGYEETVLTVSGGEMAKTVETVFLIVRVSHRAEAR